MEMRCIKKWLAQGSYCLRIRKCKWISLCLGEQVSDFSERFSYLQSSFQAALISWTKWSSLSIEELTAA